MYLIVGLGNPGNEYEHTRHNAGFRVVDVLAQQMRVNYWKQECEALTAHVQENATFLQEHNISEPVILAKPQTFMNLSGVAVRALCKTYKVEPGHVIVVHDELDIPAGSIRVKLGGGHAGHNGLRSICDKLGTKNYYRVRTGVGRPPGRMDVARFVLSVPRAEDGENFQLAISKAADATCFLLSNGLEATQQKYN